MAHGVGGWGGKAVIFLPPSISLKPISDPYMKYSSSTMITEEGEIFKVLRNMTSPALRKPETKPLLAYDQHQRQDLS